MELLDHRVNQDLKVHKDHRERLVHRVQLETQDHRERLVNLVQCQDHKERLGHRDHKVLKVQQEPKVQQVLKEHLLLQVHKDLRVYKDQ